MAGSETRFSGHAISVIITIIINIIIVTEACPRRLTLTVKGRRGPPPLSREVDEEEEEVEEEVE